MRDNLYFKFLNLWKGASLAQNENDIISGYKYKYWMKFDNMSV